MYWPFCTGVNFTPTEHIGIGIDFKVTNTYGKKCTSKSVTGVCTETSKIYTGVELVFEKKIRK